MPSTLRNTCLAAALAALATAAATAADEHARASEIVQGRCFVCHGMDGESSTPIFPRLAGQNAAYIARQLADYASGKRVSSAMQPMVEGLTAADFEALGRFFATRPTRAHAVADPQLAQAGRAVYTAGKPQAGIPACGACHGEQAQGSAIAPRLAGQHAQYTERQLKQFHTRERNNDNALMHTVASALSDAEMKAVAAYVSGLQ